MKETIVDEVKELLEVKTFDKITIKEITQNLGISRQSFYYYFNDLYEVIELIYINASETILKNYAVTENWEFGYLSILHLILSHKNMIIHTYETIEREYVDNFLYNTLYPYIENIVFKKSSNMKVKKEQKEFVAKYFTLSFIAISVDWIKREMRETPESIVKQVSILIDNAFLTALRNYEKIN